jgi:DNA repair protein RadC
MDIAEMPMAERPRERLLGLGPGALTDAELLAVLLRNGVAGQSVLDLARDVLSRFGGCAGVLAASTA